MEFLQSYITMIFFPVRRLKSTMLKGYEKQDDYINSKIVKTEIGNIVDKK